MPEVSINIVEGRTAPRYDEAPRGLTLEGIVITEQGTVAGLPIVDLKLRDAEGKLHIVCTTGRIVLAVAAEIRGVNARIHGMEEP